MKLEKERIIIILLLCWIIYFVIFVCILKKLDNSNSSPIIIIIIIYEGIQIVVHNRTEHLKLSNYIKLFNSIIQKKRSFWLLYSLLLLILHSYNRKKITLKYFFRFLLALIC